MFYIFVSNEIKTRTMYKPFKRTAAEKHFAKTGENLVQTAEEKEAEKEEIAKMYGHTKPSKNKSND